MNPTLSPELVGEVAIAQGVCARPVIARVTDLESGDVCLVPLSCGSTREDRCPACAERARRLRMQQCREGWHLDSEPEWQPASVDDGQGDDECEDRGEDEQDCSRRVRSTRRRQDAPELPRVPPEDRTVGRVFTAPDGRTYRPSMFVTLTLGSYGRVTAEGVPVDPGRYDYRRAALDALHFPKLVDRFWQNLRRCAGYQVQYFATKRQSQAGLDLGRLRTVGGLSDWWLHNVHRYAVRPSSWSKSRDRVRRIKKDLGELPVVELDYRVVTEWQSRLARTLAPRTVRHHRQTLAQVVDEAVKMGALVGNPVRAVKPLRVTESSGVALDRDETRALLGAVADHRLGAAVALLFLQGWRVSEVLGLAWEDVDLDAGTALVRRASVYVDGRGQRLGPPKTEGARGEHWLMPTVVQLLTKRREVQEQERVIARVWTQHTYEGERLGIVFTTPTGGLVLRQTVAKLVKQGAKSAGIAADLGTHAGRRSVVTTLFVEGDEALEDIARFVGHAKPSTTAGYVKRLGRRPQSVAERAAVILDDYGRREGAE